jgi:hypothetical protein
MLNLLDREFAKLAPADQTKICKGKYGGGAWDTELYSKPGMSRTTNCPCGSCGKLDNGGSDMSSGLASGASVTMSNGTTASCQGSFHVNYVLWGRMAKLCDDTFKAQLAMEGYKLWKYWGNGLQRAEDWFHYGLNHPNADQFPQYSVNDPKFEKCDSCKEVWLGIIGWGANKDGGGNWSGR